MIMLPVTPSDGCTMSRDWLLSKSWINIHKEPMTLPSTDAFFFINDAATDNRDFTRRGNGPFSQRTLLWTRVLYQSKSVDGQTNTCSFPSFHSVCPPYLSKLTRMYIAKGGYDSSQWKPVWNMTSWDYGSFLYREKKPRKSVSWSYGPFSWHSWFFKVKN